VGHPGGRLALHGQHPPLQEATLLSAEGQAMHGGHGQQGIGMRLGRRHVATALADEGHKILNDPSKG
jgi:hypothetical protein